MLNPSADTGLCRASRSLSSAVWFSVCSTGLQTHLHAGTTDWGVPSETGLHLLPAGTDIKYNNKVIYTSFQQGYAMYVWFIVLAGSVSLWFGNVCRGFGVFHKSSGNQTRFPALSHEKVSAHFSISKNLYLTILL